MQSTTFVETDCPTYCRDGKVSSTVVIVEFHAALQTKLIVAQACFCKLARVMECERLSIRYVHFLQWQMQHLCMALHCWRYRNLCLGATIQPMQPSSSPSSRTGCAALILIVFAGDQQPGMKAADVIFVIAEKPHETFRREGNDLHYTHRLPLLDALCGTTINLRHLDGRPLSIPLHDVAGPNSQKTVRGEGMPSSKSGAKGDLRIQFSIVFPKRLTEEQKAGLRQYLPRQVDT